MTTLPVSKGWCWLCVPVFGIAASMFSLENLTGHIKKPNRRSLTDAVDEAMKEVDL